MPITQQLLLKIPTILVAFIIIGGSVALAITTIFFANLFSSHYKPKGRNEVTTILFGAKTIIYSILLALILFSAWGGFKDADSDVQKEANCLIELYRSTEAFLPEIKQEVRGLLEEYTKSVINDEWKTLTKSELNLRTTEIAKKLWQIFSSYSPKTETEQIFLQESIHKLYELREYRAERLDNSKTGIHPLLWLVLIVGEMATVASIAFFTEDLRAKVTMAFLFAVLVGLIFFTIMLFDFPFTGEFTVSSEPLKQAMLSW
jgi:hypothetical protein